METASGGNGLSMLQYDENLDGFLGDDDIDDDDTNNGDVMTIDDLIDNSEVDPDDDQPDDAGNYCEDFIPGK